MVTNKELTLLNLKYQNYLTYIGVIWTVAISLVIAIGSYILTSYRDLTSSLITILMLILYIPHYIYTLIHIYLNTLRGIKVDG